MKNKIVTDITDAKLKTEIENIKLPECLQKPLEFGNAEQIKALANLQKTADDVCDTKEFEVAINFSGIHYMFVNARNEQEALDIADKEFKITEVDDICNICINNKHII